jgi:proteic killer suppression protein
MFFLLTRPLMGDPHVLFPNNRALRTHYPGKFAGQLAHSRRRAPRMLCGKQSESDSTRWLRHALKFRVFSMLDNCYVIVYSMLMIKTFADKETQKLFVSGKSKRLPSDLLRRAIRRLEFIHFTNDINDLLVPPSNRLHAQKGDRKGQHSISINDQWRICFRFIEGDAYDVEINDYH